MSGGQQAPLVSVGVPVRNGGQALSLALESLVAQRHGHLEIIISDNASTDGTEQRCRELAAQDGRVSYTRHDPPVTAWQNFMYVLSRARGSYFLWAAHDDTRTADYVGSLVRALEARPEAVLAFGDLARFPSEGAVESAVAVPYEFETHGRSFFARLARYGRGACAEIYGVWRTEVLQSYPGWELDYSPDVPLLVYGAAHGEFVHAAGPTFFQCVRNLGVSADEIARQNSYAGVRPCRYVRLAWMSARAGVLAQQRRGRRRSLLLAFAAAYAPLRFYTLKTQLYERAPSSARLWWRRIRSRVAA